MGHPRYILLLLVLASWPAIAHAQAGERADLLEPASVAEQSASPLALAEAMHQAWADGDTASAERNFSELAVRWPEHPTTLLLSAERLKRAENIYAALQALGHGAELHPTDPRFPLELGRMYYGLREADHALPYAQQALQISYSAEAVSLLVDCQDSLDLQAAAGDTWARYIALYSNDHVLQAEYAGWLTVYGEPDEALERYAIARQLDPGVPDYYAKPVRTLLLDDEFEQAVSLLAAGIEAAPCEQLYNQLALHHLDLGHVDAAVSTWEAGLVEFPKSELLLTWLVRTEIDRGNLAAALNVASASLSPDSSAGMFLLAGGLYGEQGEPARALEVVELGLKAHPHDEGLARRGMALKFAAGIELGDAEDPESTWWRAELLRKAGELDAALLAVKQGILDSRGDLRLRVLELTILNETDRADRTVPKALALAEEPGLSADGYFAAVHTCLLALQPDLAAQVARQGLALHPGSSRLQSQLVNLLINAADTSGLIAILTDPAYAATELPSRARVLGWAYLVEGNYLLAEAHLTLAIRSAVPDLYREDLSLGPVYERLGQAQYFRGSYEDARSSLTRSLALASKHHGRFPPERPGPYIWLGLTLIELGDSAGASSSLNEALRIGGNDPAESAWYWYGRGRLNQLDGDAEGAESCFNTAEYWGQDDPALASALFEARGVL